MIAGRLLYWLHNAWLKIPAFVASTACNFHGNFSVTQAEVLQVQQNELHALINETTVVLPKAEDDAMMNV